MNIKQASKQSGVSAPNIRFYEKEGLLNPARLPGNDYRDYTEQDIRTLRFIRMLRMLDVPLAEPCPPAAARKAVFHTAQAKGGKVNMLLVTRCTVGSVSYDKK